MWGFRVTRFPRLIRYFAFIPLGWKFLSYVCYLSYFLLLFITAFKERYFRFFFLGSIHCSHLDICKGSVFKWLYINFRKPRLWLLLQEGAIFGEKALIFEVSGSETSDASEAAGGLVKHRLLSCISVFLIQWVWDRSWEFAYFFFFQVHLISS